LCNKLKTVGINMHRLTLTGYLKAMADVGILNEREIKPAKVYKVQSGKIKDIYDIVGMKSREFEEKSADVCLYTLYKLFKRPIFKMELEKCGVNKPLNSKRVFGRERAKSLQMLEDNKIILIPKNNPAYIPNIDFEKEFIKILSSTVEDKYNLKNYMLEGDSHQLKLEL